MTLLQPCLHFRPGLSCGWIPPVLTLTAIWFFALGHSEGNLLRASGNAVPDFFNESETLFDAEVEDFAHPGNRLYSR